MFLGNLWKFLSPCVQIGVYWFVFGIGLRQGRDVAGYPFVVWLTCGVSAWFTASQCVSTGAASIYRKARLLTKSNIPTVLIPVSAVLSVILNNIWTVLIVIIVFVGNGCTLTVYAFNLLYYLVFLFCFSCALAFVTSVFVMLARDFQRVVQMIMRFLFFLSPVFWDRKDNMPALFLTFDSLNPFGYIIRGFRGSMLYHTPFWHDTKSLLIFWGMTIGLYLLGIGLQRKLRSNILDYL